MVHKVNTLTPQEMQIACRRMTDSYDDYEMTGNNMGMCEHLDREHFYRFVRSYFELAVRNSSLYRVGDDHEGYFIFETPETKGNFYGSLLQAKWMLNAFGLSGGIKYIREILNSGTYIGTELKKRKEPFTKIEFIAVAKECQGRGYMRQMIDYAFSESDRLGLPCILTTDDEKKVKIYEHFGMKMVCKHVLSPNAVYYEMIKGQQSQISVCKTI